MTLVVAASWLDAFVLCGDVMVSRPHAEKKDLPTNLSRHADLAIEYIDAVYRPAGLVQKICIVTSWLAVAFSGSVLEAKALVSYLSGKTTEVRLSVEEVKTILNSSNLNINNSEYIFVQLDDHYQVTVFGVNTIAYQYEHIENLITIGSGTPDFLREVFYPAKRELDRVGSIVSFFAKGIMRQGFTGYGESNLWGSGFEVLTVGPNGFEKRLSTLVRVWEVDTDAEGNPQLGLRPFALFQEYVGTELIIASIFPDIKLQRLFAAPSLVGNHHGYVQGGPRSPEMIIDICLYFDDNNLVGERIFFRPGLITDPPKLYLSNEGYKFLRKAGDTEYLIEELRSGVRS